MNKWRNNIKIKQYINEDETDENLKNISESIVGELDILLNKEKRWLDKVNENKIKYSDLEKENIEYILFQLEEIRDDFDWLSKEVLKGNPNDYSYSSWLEAFNGYLERLYDEADTYVCKKNGVTEKFLWIE